MAAKRSRSTDESFSESLESRSRSSSPEIGYVGSPAVFKLYEKNGQAFVIKKPINIQKQPSKKLDESSIASLLSSSNSEDELNVENINKTGAKIIAKSKANDTEFELLNTPIKDARLLESLREYNTGKTTKSAQRNLSQSLNNDKTGERATVDN